MAVGVVIGNRQDRSDHLRGKASGEIDEVQRNTAGEVNGEIGNLVAIGVALQNGDAARGIVEIVERARGAVECGRTQKVERIEGRRRSDGVDAGNVDVIDPCVKSAIRSCWPIAAGLSPVANTKLSAPSPPISTSTPVPP